MLFCFCVCTKHAYVSSNSCSTAVCRQNMLKLSYKGILSITNTSCTRFLPVDDTDQTALELSLPGMSDAGAKPFCQQHLLFFFHIIKKSTYPFGHSTLCYFSVIIVSIIGTCCFS
uniref:Uncharacterized protein n=1 Tax=Anguilla anguilla TaxID=7936 RepID=A0A0E9PVF6_ANGAN